MPETLHLEIITPLQKLLEVEAEWVTVPGAQGELGILPEHVPLVTTMDSGVLQYAAGGAKVRVAVHYGYAQVQGQRISVLAEMAEQAADIDLERARSAERQARQKLAELAGAPGADEAELRGLDAKLRRALTRQQLKS